MAFLAVTSLMRTIEVQFLHPQPRVCLTNKEQIKSLHEKLGYLLVFLDDSEKRADHYSQIKDVAEKIRNVTLKAEEDIEEELLKVHHYHTLDRTLRRVVQDIDELTRSTENTNRLAKNLTVDSSQRGSNIEDAMVGHAKEWDKVMSQLLPSSHKRRQVMAMVGMGGIGKTTFVKKIYKDLAGTSHFDLYAWTTMSQEYNKGQSLFDLCRCIMPMSSTFNNTIEGDLDDQLRRSLKGQRYLIILDDMWTTEAWDYFMLCFPDDNNGSRVLLTTRDKEVAQYAIKSWGADSGEYCHDMGFLNQDESWHLFSQKILDKNCLNNEFEVIGKNIVQKCQGLPLTIVVLAGLLSTMNKSLDEWKNVETTINSLVTLNLYEQFSRILTLSYSNLPSHLKGCFLYLGVFHEDCEIPIKKLIRLWIAEGFIETIRNRSPEEVGLDYLQDLINRSLVMVHRHSFDGQIKTCRMHDLLHELCVNKAKEENLLYLEGTGSSDYFERFVQLPSKRWLSLKVVIPAFHLVVSLKKCRSILCFNMGVYGDREWYLIANSFKMLRVLDLSKINFKKGMPPDITELVFLRYLALASSKLLNHIPLRKNWNLQTLVISEDDNGACRMPRGIWVLPQLRHLQIYHQVSIDLPEVVQENLHTLYWLSTLQCTKEGFERIPNVKELGILVASSLGLNNMCCLNHLEKLKVQGSFYPLHLPRPDANVFPRNLKKLTFVRTLIPWEGMNIISKLPHLEVLKLRNFACVGQEWELTDEGFSKLKVLLISLTNLKEWTSDVESPFPVLERLLLRNCFELKEMSEIGLDGIHTLQLIKLEYCFDSLVKSAEMIKEEQRSYGNNIDVLHSNTRPDEDHVESCEDESVPRGLTNLWFEARKLRIEWGQDPRYWNWYWDSGFEVAVLEKVSWFEIRVTFDVRCLCKMTLYSAYLIFKLDELGEYRDVETALTGVRYEKDKNIYGWMGGENRHSQVFLAKLKSYGDCGRFPDDRSDGWMEIKLGDFYVSTGNEGEVELQIWHTTDQYWMSGFVVRGIQVRQN